MKSDEVINSIKSSDIKMRPRWYFIAQTVLTIIAASLMFVVLLFVVSFIDFALQQNGGFFAIGFGPAGFMTFFYSLPWVFFLLSLVLIFALAILLKHYPAVYHRPLAYLLLLLIFVVTVVALLLSISPFHSQIIRYVSNNRLPIVEQFYEGETAPGINTYRGEVALFIPNGFILENTVGRTSTVVVVAKALPELTGVKVGDTVIIFGRGIASATIEALGVERMK
jgi:hypothetical protein